MPLRTRREPALRDEDLEALIPARARARGGQRFGEARVEAELAIEFEREPAAAPLTRMMEGKRVQADADDALAVRGRGAVVRKERDLGGGIRAGGVGGERLAPGGALGVIDLAEVKHLPLRDATLVQAFVFHHTPASVFLAIFFANLGTQKHNDRRAYTRGGGGGRGGSSLQALLRNERGLSLANPCALPPKTVATDLQSAKEG